MSSVPPVVPLCRRKYCAHQRACESGSPARQSVPIRRTTARMVSTCSSLRLFLWRSFLFFSFPLNTRVSRGELSCHALLPVNIDSDRRRPCEELVRDPGRIGDHHGDQEPGKNQSYEDEGSVQRHVVDQ